MAIDTTSPRTGFNLKDARAAIARDEDGTDVELLDYRDEPVYKPDGTPATWRIAGAYSATVRRAREAQRQREEKRRGKPATTSESIRDDALFLADCSLGWDGVVDGDAPIPFSRDAAVGILEELPFLRARLFGGIGDKARFFERKTLNGSPPLSATTNG
jgi:hypothetical protein